MKKIYLYAVVLSSVLAACSSDTTVEDTLTVNQKSMFRTSTQSSLVNLITEIENACKGMVYTITNNLVSQVEEEALKNETFRQLAKQRYTAPNPADLNYIVNVDKAEIIDQLSY